MKTMTWIKYKFAIGFGVTTLLAVGATTIALSQSQPTVYSLLANPPIISNATFEREINPKTMPPGFPAGAQKQTFSFSLDGENYRMDLEGYMVGKYGDILWQTAGEQVTRFNLKWNKVDGDLSGVTAGNTAAKMSINSLLTFGINTGKNQNSVWDATHKKLTFQDEDGNEYVAEFNEINGLPITAAIRSANASTADALVAYHYDTKFFGGQLPVEITRYAGNVVSEDTKIEVVRIKSLEISKQHLPLAKLDPDKYLHFTNANYMPLFYSNNIPYWTDAKGKVRRVLTAEENAVKLKKLQGNK